MNKLKSILLATSFMLAASLTISCSDDSGDGGNDSINKELIGGVSQKGPFIEGSTVIMHELDNNFARTGKTFTDRIIDDKGSFEIKGVKLASPYAILEVNGQYRNEITGKVTSGAISLFAIADLSEKNNINVNILTHLEYYRVLNLIEKEGKSITEAKTQAQKEILAVFGINSDNFKSSEDMSIFGTTESDAALLAISVLLQANLNEGEFLQRLTKFSTGIEETGEWNDEEVKAAMADWALNPPKEPAYCDYGGAISDPQTGDFILNCWAMPTGDLCQNGVLVNFCPGDEPASTFEFVKNNMLSWELSSDIPDFEKYFSVYWAENYELGVCNSATNKMIKKNNNENSANLNKSFICEDGTWSVATYIEENLGACTEAIQGKVGKIEPIYYYICTDNEWKDATEYDYDTYGFGACSTEGELKDGLGSGKKYICENSAWRLVSYIEMKCKEKTCETFTDPRDNKNYAYVVIGEQTWMAENLNYEPLTGDSGCYSDEMDCIIAGRMYDWDTAMEVCPVGWHLPSNEEWVTLNDYVGNVTKLKAAGGWCYQDPNSICATYDAGTDDYGFAAIPSDGYGTYGSWWSSDSGDDFAAYSYQINLYMENGNLYDDFLSKKNFHNVRCIKNKD